MLDIVDTKLVWQLYAAAALGITSLERHITLDRAMYGSDQAASIEPSGLRQLVGAVRKIQNAMGDGEKRMIDAEVPIARKLREHLDPSAIIEDYMSRVIMIIQARMGSTRLPGKSMMDLPAPLLLVAF